MSSNQTEFGMDPNSRRFKAEKTLAILRDVKNQQISKLKILEIGCAAGGVSVFLTPHVDSYVGIDVDTIAISEAKNWASEYKSTAIFYVMNAEELSFSDATFDVVICSHVYEHVNDPLKMLKECFRVMKSDGCCYFAAGNKLGWMEPHYRLPLLAPLPKSVGNLYLKIFRNIYPYRENHLTFWGLKRLVSNFEILDYTRKIVDDPVKFHALDLLKPHSTKHKLAKFIMSYLFWLAPTYIWILKKPVSRND